MSHARVFYLICIHFRSGFDVAGALKLNQRMKHAQQLFLHTPTQNCMHSSTADPSLSGHVLYLALVASSLPNFTESCRAHAPSFVTVQLPTRSADAPGGCSSCALLFFLLLLLLLVLQRQGAATARQRARIATAMIKELTASEQKSACSVS